MVGEPRGVGALVGGGVKPVEEQIQLVRPLLACRRRTPPTVLGVARDHFQAFPHLPHIVSLELFLQPPPVPVLTSPNSTSELPLDPFQLFFVPWSEDPLLLLQQALQFRSHPGFVVGKTPYPPSGHRVFHAEVYVVGDAVS